MTPHRMTASFLRCLAVLQILTTAVAFFPQSWIASGHAWLGLGHMPAAVSLDYIIRGAAFVQGAIGVLLWVMAGDVARYRPLVIATGMIYLLSAPPLYIIAAMTGMPRFWCVLDSSAALAVGGILLVLCRMSLTDESQRMQPVR